MKIFEWEIFGIMIAPSYYGLMYALGFIIGYMILKKRAMFTQAHLDDLFIYIFAGVVLGGRLGYILFYNPVHFFHNPVDIIKFGQGGMAFHGGVIGVILVMYIFSKRKNLSFRAVADQICLVLPIGLFLGRIGNYLNQELLGYSGYNGPLAVVQNGVGYFPSPLLEALLEGLVLYGILYFFYAKKSLKPGQIGALFLIFYAIFRMFVEAFFRTPDAHIGYILGFLTMGIILSLPMLIIGIFIFFYVRNK